MLNFVQRSLNRLREIEGDLVLHVRRELLLAVFEDSFDLVGGGEGICPWGEVNAKGCGGRLVKPRPQRISLRAELHPTHIFDFDFRTVRIGAHDNFRKLLRIGQQTKGAHVVLVFLSAWGGLGANNSGRRLQGSGLYRDALCHRRG